jgi:hypothetical protein
MASHISLIAFGTFGNPNGFRQTFFDGGSKELAKSVKTFDLNTNALKLFPNSKIYSIRKEYAAGFNSIAYSLYSYAKEKNSDRSGTFIGSSILFTERIGEENVTLNQLNEFHSSLIAKNVQNDVIMVNHSDRLSVSKPKEFEKIEYHLREIENLNFIQTTGKTLVVFSPTNGDVLSKLFKSSIDLLNVYDTIYFTDSREVAEFVNQKGIFKIIQNVGDKLDFEQEIQNLLEQRRIKREQSISDFEREVQRLNDDKIETISDFQLQIEQNERVHKENEHRINESKKDLETIEQFYKEFSLKIQELVNQLKSGEKLDEVKQVYNENKNRFIGGLNTLKRPNYVNKLPKNNPKSKLEPEFDSTKIENKHPRQRDKGEEIDGDIGYKIDIFKFATLILVFLLVFSWVYFLFFKSKQEEPVIQQREIVNMPIPENIEEKIAPSELQPLNPIPNSELNENDYRLVAKKIVNNSRIDDVVKLIFDMNPTDIRNHYIGQEGIYSKHLLELNKGCFEEKDGTYYFSKDTLRHIPSYKK